MELQTWAPAQRSQTRAHGYQPGLSQTRDADPSMWRGCGSGGGRRLDEEVGIQLLSKGNGEASQDPRGTLLDLFALCSGAGPPCAQLCRRRLFVYAVLTPEHAVTARGRMLFIPNTLLCY